MAYYYVCSWIYGSIIDGVLDLVRGAAESCSRGLWVAIENLFEVNKAPRSIFLSHKFHLMTQGDSSVHDYCLRFKMTADVLRDVGQPVSEGPLVLNLLHGLNKQYSNTTDNIIASENLTFAYACNQLLLKELRLANNTKNKTVTALVAHTASSSGSSNCCSSTSDQSSGSNGKKKQKKGRKKPYYGGHNSAPNTGGPPTGPLCLHFFLG